MRSCLDSFGAYSVSRDLSTRIDIPNRSHRVRLARSPTVRINDGLNRFVFVVTPNLNHPLPRILAAKCDVPRTLSNGDIEHHLLCDHCFASAPNGSPTSTPTVPFDRFADTIETTLPTQLSEFEPNLAANHRPFVLLVTRPRLTPSK